MVRSRTFYMFPDGLHSKARVSTLYTLSWFCHFCHMFMSKHVFSKSFKVI